VSRVFHLRFDLAIVVHDDELQEARVTHVNRRVVNLRHHAVAQGEPDFRFERVGCADALLARALPLRVFAGRAGGEVRRGLRVGREREEECCEDEFEEGCH
jgi:hypothetical protein